MFDDDDKQFIPPKGFGRKVTLEDKVRAIKDDDEFVEHWANEIRSIKNMSTANILRSMVFKVMTAESNCPIYFGEDYEINEELERAIRSVELMYIRYANVELQKRLGQLEGMTTDEISSNPKDK